MRIVDHVEKLRIWEEALIFPERMMQLVCRDAFSKSARFDIGTLQEPASM